MLLDYSRIFTLNTTTYQYTRAALVAGTIHGAVKWQFYRWCAHPVPVRLLAPPLLLLLPPPPPQIPLDGGFRVSQNIRGGTHPQNTKEQAQNVLAIVEHHQARLLKTMTLICVPLALGALDPQTGWL